MPVIRLETDVAASPQRCFDLARDVELHQRSTASSHERADDGAMRAAGERFMPLQTSSAGSGSNYS